MIRSINLDGNMVQTIGWTPAKKTLNSIGSILEMPDSEQTQSMLFEKMIATSFFLPLDVLALPQYKVSPLYALHSTEFAACYDNLLQQHNIHADCDYYLLAFAKSVGVSLRQNIYTGKRYAVLKLWYGKNPWEKLGTGSDAQYARRIESLRRFIATDWKTK
jgi:hypothetical protein